MQKWVCPFLQMQKGWTALQIKLWLPVEVPGLQKSEWKQLSNQAELDKCQMCNVCLHECFLVCDVQSWDCGKLPCCLQQAECMCQCSGSRNWC